MGESLFSFRLNKENIAWFNRLENIETVYDTAADFSILQNVVIKKRDWYQHLFFTYNGKKIIDFFILNDYFFYITEVTNNNWLIFYEAFWVRETPQWYVHIKFWFWYCDETNVWWYFTQSNVFWQPVFSSRVNNPISQEAPKGESKIQIRPLDIMQENYTNFYIQITTNTWRGKYKKWLFFKIDDVEWVGTSDGTLYFSSPFVIDNDDTFSIYSGITEWYVLKKTWAKKRAWFEGDNKIAFRFTSDGGLETMSVPLLWSDDSIVYENNVFLCKDWLVYELYQEAAFCNIYKKTYFSSVWNILRFVNAGYALFCFWTQGVFILRTVWAAEWDAFRKIINMHNIILYNKDTVAEFMWQVILLTNSKQLYSIHMTQEWGVYYQNIWEQVQHILDRINNTKTTKIVAHNYVFYVMFTEWENTIFLKYNAQEKTYYYNVFFGNIVFLTQLNEKDIFYATNTYVTKKWGAKDDYKEIRQRVEYIFWEQLYWAPCKYLLLKIVLRWQCKISITISNWYNGWKKTLERYILRQATQEIIDEWFLLGWQVLWENTLWENPDSLNEEEIHCATIRIWISWMFCKLIFESIDDFWFILYWFDMIYIPVKPMITPIKNVI